MADLTANASIRIRFPNLTKIEKWVLDNSVAQKIYKGQAMILDVSVDTLYVRGYVDATVVTTSDIFIGIANEPITVATTDNEVDNEVEIMVEGEVGFKSAVFTDASVGLGVYMTDSGTLAGVASAATNPYIGTLARVVDGYCYVKLAGAGTKNASA